MSDLWPDSLTRDPILSARRDQYSEILMQKWVGVFNTIFDEDNYTPIVVETERDYVDITQKFPFTDAQLEQASGAGERPDRGRSGPFSGVTGPSLLQDSGQSYAGQS